MWCDSWGLLDYYEESARKSQGSDKKIPLPRMSSRVAGPVDRPAQSQLSKSVQRSSAASALSAVEGTKALAFCYSAGLAVSAFADFADGHGAPASIHARSRSISSDVSPGYLWRRLSGGISRSSIASETLRINWLSSA
jgi:hypothetical protein